jgi:hypothetical protein
MIISAFLSTPTPAPFRDKKIAPDRMMFSVKDELKIRGTTLFCGWRPHAQRDTIISPATDVCLHVAEYWTEVVPCTLRGPFDDSLSAWLSAPQALCGRALIVISTSTVSIFIYFCIIIKGFF